MHLRPKAWTRPELLSCGFFIEKPWEYCGHWQDAFKKNQPIHLELGCGKGSFISILAEQHPEINYLAIDMIDTVLGMAQRKIKKAYGDQPIDNLRIMPWDISRIDKILNTDDTIDRIYINFCNPWPRHKHHKKRLTHPKQLVLYKPFLAPGAEIHFKTDDDGLFKDSLNYFTSEGFTLKTVSTDLHHDPQIDTSFNIITEHEQMFSEQGIPIKYCVAGYNPE